MLLGIYNQLVRGLTGPVLETQENEIKTAHRPETEKRQNTKKPHKKLKTPMVHPRWGFRRTRFASRESTNPFAAAVIYRCCATATCGTPPVPPRGSRWMPELQIHHKLVLVNPKIEGRGEIKLSEYLHFRDQIFIFGDPKAPNL